MKKNKISGFKNQTLYSYTDLKQIIYKEDLYVTDIGYFPNAKYHSITRSKPINENILLYCTEGCGQVSINEQVFILKANQFIIIPYLKAHTYQSDNKRPWSIFWMHYHETTTKEVINGSIDDQFNTTFIQYIFSNMLHSLANKSQNTMVYINKNARLLLVSLNHYLEAHQLKNDHLPEFDRFNDYINLHLKNKITLEDLCNYSNYSPSHINKIFNLKYQLSPIDYIIKIKIEHSCILLRNTNLSIKDIACAIGYDDSLYYSRLFKKKMHLSPSQYRKQN
ncbi:MAG: AraC family transcriptional regulator [Bacilli bacterium]